tara:strand:+ start:1822 stop:2766 length:945 start_codon:yes stop_codon:yes gene_type:complete
MLNNNFKLFVKEFIGKIISFSGIYSLIAKDKFFIFCYHEITDNPSVFQKKNKLFVNKKNFKKQISFIKKLFNPIDPRNLNLNSEFNKPTLITFDDGYKGSFNFGVNYLEKSKIIPIFFLNMSAIKNDIPLLPASLEFLDINFKNYKTFIKDFKISKPISLNIKPIQFKNFEKYINLNKKKINKYQGEMVSFNHLKNEQYKNKFFISDHLYEHYNCLILTKKELKKLSNKNIELLKNFKNFLKFFSFPNGVPDICFNRKNVSWIKNLNYEKAFSSGNSININSKKFLLDRINLNNDDDTYYKFLFKIFQSHLRKK